MSWGPGSKLALGTGRYHTQVSALEERGREGEVHSSYGNGAI